MANTPLILPSLLSANSMKLGEEIAALVQAGADMLHLDIMDNHYVPNLTFGPGLCESLHRHFPKIGIDVHLMAKPVDDLIVLFAKAGARRISIHPEASLHLDRSLQLIRNLNCKAGLVLNPTTSIECIEWCQRHLDFVLVMMVNPGFAGQTLIPDLIPKIARIHQQYPNLSICVDGGVGLDNIGQLAHAGATEFVAGSAVFQHADYHKTIQSLRQSAMTFHV